MRTSDIISFLIAAVWTVDCVRGSPCCDETFGNPYGTFSGMVTQSNTGRTYPVSVSYNASGIVTTYSTLSCGNTVPITPSNIGSGFLMWTERIEYGTSRCVQGGTVTLTRDSQEQWDFYVIVGSVTVTGRLTLTPDCSEICEDNTPSPISHRTRSPATQPTPSPLSSPTRTPVPAVPVSTGTPGDPPTMRPTNAPINAPRGTKTQDGSSSGLVGLAALVAVPLILLAVVFRKRLGCCYAGSKSTAGMTRSVNAPNGGAFDDQEVVAEQDTALAQVLAAPRVGAVVGQETPRDYTATTNIALENPEVAVQQLPQHGGLQLQNKDQARTHIQERQQRAAAAVRPPAEPAIAAEVPRDMTADSWRGYLPQNKDQCRSVAATVPPMVPAVIVDPMVENQRALPSGQTRQSIDP